MRDASARKLHSGIASANSRGHAVDDPDAVADYSGHVDCALVFSGHAAGHRFPVSHAECDVERTTEHRELRHRGLLL
jgi:hypothetical protein